MLRVGIRVKPGVSRARASVGGRHGDALVVAVSARAVDGKATEAALRAIATAFGVRRADVTLAGGRLSRDKVVEIAGPEPDLAQRLEALLLQA
jgi:uncharacterized protein YggU (UPF0235/DUF167 family)